MKIIGLIGAQLRRAINEHRDYVSGEELSDAIWQASYSVFGQYAGHVALYRPNQPLPPSAYGLNDPINAALNPFVREQRYSRNTQTGVLPISADGKLLFPVTTTSGAVVIPNSFQRPVGLIIPGARKIRALNENAGSTTNANSLTRPQARFPTRSNIPGGWQISPVPTVAADKEFVVLRYLGAPPQPVFAEMLDPDNPPDLIYDDANSVDIGWVDVTAINEIIAFATRLLGGQTKDQQAVSIATQTTQLGA